MQGAAHTTMAQSTTSSAGQGGAAREPKSYGAVLRSAAKGSATVAENLKAIYAKFRSIVGPPETDEDGYTKCKNCGDWYDEGQNRNYECVWYSETHKGLFLCDVDSDAWYGWHEANPPMESSYWKEEGYAGQGRHKWTGCGCDRTNDECEREDKHRPEGYPPSVDEWEDEDSKYMSDGEFDHKESQKLGEEMLMDNYIRDLNCIIQRKLGKSVP